MLPTVDDLRRLREQHALAVAAMDQTQWVGGGPVYPRAISDLMRSLGSDPWGGLQYDHKLSRDSRRPFHRYPRGLSQSVHPHCSQRTFLPRRLAGCPGGRHPLAAVFERLEELVGRSDQALNNERRVTAPAGRRASAMNNHQHEFFHKSAVKLRRRLLAGLVASFGSVAVLAALQRGPHAPDEWTLAVLGLLFCLLGSLIWRQTNRPFLVLQPGRLVIHRLFRTRVVSCDAIRAVAIQGQRRQPMNLYSSVLRTFPGSIHLDTLWLLIEGGRPVKLILPGSSISAGALQAHTGLRVARVEARQLGEWRKRNTLG